MALPIHLSYLPIYLHLPIVTHAVTIHLVRLVLHLILNLHASVTVHILAAISIVELIIESLEVWLLHLVIALV